MRTLGMPSASTVASDMAFGSLGSATSAALSHSAKTANGFASVTKSLLIKENTALSPSLARVRSPLVLRVSYTGQAGRRQLPVLFVAAACFLVLSIAGCARVGMPFSEAAEGIDPI